MFCYLIGDVYEWINEIPTVPTHSLAKLQPSQRSWDYSCVIICFRCHIYSHNFFQFCLQVGAVSAVKTSLQNFFLVYATAGQEDPFELDTNLSLSSGRLGEVVRGSTPVQP